MLLLQAIITIFCMFQTVCAKFGNIVRQKDFFYFAYGSNLLEERLHVQIKGAQFVSIAVLKDFEVAFVDFEEQNRWHSAAATIEKKPGSSVWGCIWLVPSSFAAELDKQETHYHRLEVLVQPVRSTNERFNLNLTKLPEFLKCRTYQYEKADQKYGLPSPQYKHVIVTGAEEHGLAPKYIEWLRNNFADNGYDGPVEVQLKALENMAKKHGKKMKSDLRQEDEEKAESSTTEKKQ